MTLFKRCELNSQENPTPISCWKNLFFRTHFVTSAFSNLFFPIPILPVIYIDSSKSGKVDITGSSLTTTVSTNHKSVQHGELTMLIYLLSMQYGDWLSLCGQSFPLNSHCLLKNPKTTWLRIFTTITHSFAKAPWIYFHYPHLLSFWPWVSFIAVTY